jgi:hypothetical protein
VVSGGTDEITGTGLECFVACVLNASILLKDRVDVLSVPERLPRRREGTNVGLLEWLKAAIPDWVLLASYLDSLEASTEGALRSWVLSVPAVTSEGVMGGLREVGGTAATWVCAEVGGMFIGRWKT